MTLAQLELKIRAIGACFWARVKGEAATLAGRPSPISTVAPPPTTTPPPIATASSR
jgi:hypothetical protein